MLTPPENLRRRASYAWRRASDPVDHLAPLVLRDLRVRQDQEALLGQPLQGDLGHLLRLEQLAGEGDRQRRRVLRLDAGHEHVRAYALRA
jgi:hypothetical protein